MEHLPLIAIFTVNFAINVLANHVSDPFFGGTVVNPGEFPHSVFFKYENETEPACGGAIIGSKYILTRAMCLTWMGPPLEVMVGCVVYDSPYCQPYQVKETIRHPNYTDFEYYRNDIGVVVLTKDIEFHMFARIIPLTSKHIEEYTSLNVTGMDPYDAVDQMKWQNVISTNYTYCDEFWPAHVFDRSKTFCTEPGTFAYRGTWGFPVELSGYLVGISMGGNYADLMLRVEPFLLFIFTIIQG